MKRRDVRKRNRKKKLLKAKSDANVTMKRSVAPDQDSQSELSASDFLHLSLNSDLSTRSPFDCTFSCCLSKDTAGDQQAERNDKSSSIIFRRNLSTLKKAKTSSFSSEIIRDPIYNKWQEFKLLKKRIKDIKNCDTF